MIDIGAFVPHDINERGDVVGFSAFRAVVWTRTTGLVDLGPGGAVDARDMKVFGVTKRLRHRSCIAA